MKPTRTWPAKRWRAPQHRSARGRRLRGCLRSVNDAAMMESVDTSVDRWVLVPAKRLDDLLETSRMAADRLPSNDPLTMALKASIADTKISSLVDPTVEG